MAGWLDRMRAKPWVAHLLRAVERYLARLGSQFGAAITYFSVLALVPTLMLAFAILGFVLTVLRPDLIEVVVQAVTEAIGGTDEATNATFVAFVRDTLRNYAAVGLVGLLTAAYSGAGWMGNLKNAVRAQWRAEPDLQPAKQNIVLATLVNLLTLLGLLAAIVVTFALAAVSTALADSVVGWLGLNAVGWLEPVLRLVPLAVSIGAGWVLFVYLYRVLPETRPPWQVLRRGALLGAVGLAALQYLTSFLISIFAGNKAAALFGPVIVVMLFFNLFAQLILFVAAWIATSDEVLEAAAVEQQPVRFALHPAGAEPAEPPAMVPQQVAVPSVQVGLGAGYVTGAATGVGLGAAFAFLVARLARRRG